MHIAQKKWGQNFLRSQAAVEKIVAAVQPEPGDTIIEIGPGKGALTRELARLGCPLVAIEIDPTLAASLRAELGQTVHIVEDDATFWQPPPGPFRVVGNLPYNVATPIIRSFIRQPGFVRGVFMVQKEVGDRMVAAPRSESYGFLTLYVRLFAEARTLLNLGPGAFDPPPQVRSTVVVLDAVSRSLSSESQQIIDLISAAFRMRRKTLLNNLNGYKGLPREEALSAMEEAGLAAGVRAEAMTLADFDGLAQIIERRAVATPRPEGS
jgi:16S rRNA (adenine1518-N6/adenine1519-N6)-dimethyltransferase